MKILNNIIGLGRTVLGGATDDGSTVLQVAGNIGVQGVARRITGDMSNATLSDRLSFQTSVANGNTVVSGIPNGTSVVSGFSFYNKSSQTDCHSANFFTTTGAMVFQSKGVGAPATAQIPIHFRINTTTGLALMPTNNVIIGNGSTTETAGGERLQVTGDVNVTGVYKINGVDAFATNHSLQDSSNFGIFNSTGTSPMLWVVTGANGIADGSINVQSNYVSIGSSGVAGHVDITGETANLYSTNTNILGIAAIGDPNDNNLGTPLIVNGSANIAANLNFTGTGSRITGDFSSGTTNILDKTLLKSSSAGSTIITMIPSTGGTVSGINAFNSETPDNSSKVGVTCTAAAAFLQSGRTGTGLYLPLNINVDNVSAIYVTASGTATAGVNPLVLIGATTTTDTVSKLQVTGDVNVTGTYKKNGVDILPLVVTDTDIVSYLTPSTGWIYLALATTAELPTPGTTYTLTQCQQMVCECADTGFIYMYYTLNSVWRQVGDSSSQDVGFFFLGTEITHRHIEFNLTTPEVYIFVSGGFNSEAFYITGRYTCHFIFISADTRYQRFDVYDNQATYLGWNSLVLADYTAAFKFKSNQGLAEIHCWPYTEGNLRGGGLNDEGGGNGPIPLGYVLSSDEYNSFTSLFNPASLYIISTNTTVPESAINGQIIALQGTLTLTIPTAYNYDGCEFTLIANGMNTLTIVSEANDQNFYGDLNSGATTVVYDLQDGDRLYLINTGASWWYIYRDQVKNNLVMQDGITAIKGRTVFGGGADDEVSTVQIVGTSTERFNLKVTTTNSYSTSNTFPVYFAPTMTGDRAGNAMNVLGVLGTYSPTGTSLGSIQNINSSPRWKGNIAVDTVNAYVGYLNIDATSSGSIVTYNAFKSGIVTKTAGSTTTIANFNGLAILDVNTGLYTGRVTGIYSTIDTYSTEDRWNIYLVGTARNYFAGNLQIGSTTATAGAEKLQVTGNTSVSGRTLLGGATDDSATTLQVAGSESISGNLNFTGSGNRITGNLNGSDSPGNRLSFQASTANNSSVVGVIPNGTSVVSGLSLYNDSGLMNYNALNIVTSATAMIIQAKAIGAPASGQLPIQFKINNTIVMTITATGNLMAGSSTETAGAEKLQVAGNASISGRTLLGGITDDSTTTLQVLGKASFGNSSSAADATVFETDGTLKMQGAATVWNDAFVDGLSLTGGATDPPVFAAFIGTIYGSRFDDGATKSAHGTIEIPHDYKQGSNLEFHIHWSPTTTNTGYCRWGVEYTIASANGTFGAATTATINQVADGVANKHQVTTIVTISGTNRLISDVICFRIYREGANAADTFTGNAFLHRVAIHYECDTLGSRQVTTK